MITGIDNRMFDGEGIPDGWRCSVLVPLQCDFRFDLFFFVLVIVLNYYLVLV